MSLIYEDAIFPQFTLRKHTHSITTIEFIKLPIQLPNNAIDNKSNNKPILKPFPLSGDEFGNLYLWDLKTHRTIKELNNAHKSSILTIKQLGIDQFNNINLGLWGYILTHSRDNTIKIWKLFDPYGKIIIDGEKFEEIPVNSLNYSNISNFEQFLITPNTLNSNFFDIYDLSFLYKNNHQSLKRLFNQIDLYSLALNQGFKIKEFIGNTDKESVNRVEKFGIIMKFLWINSKTIAIGYESGHVVLFQISIESNDLKVLSISNEHYPNPILGLELNKSTSLVYSSSISSKIVQHSIQSPYSIEIIPLIGKFNKISGIIANNNKLILSSWSGIIKFFQIDNSNKLIQLGQFKKLKGLTSSNLNIIGNNSNDNTPEDIESQKSKLVKPTCMSLIPIQMNSDHLRIGLLDRRDLKIINQSWLAIGFSDGTILIYTDIS
ncbi:hypothetical protein WICMUC_000512 [Wickerhamomyces mucosus]|uniref:ASTRA-associated protein 1 n=1 Tax=Wickerhamomyces mucosus TaxID=1378264 RepID=A0A9P8PXE5_9ASCO|nr:hypothetical protein WICMUC_000512 [Wickerhamomyces mucosus]